MNKQKLFGALDGLFAYDEGGTDCGIKDDALKAAVFSYLKSQRDEHQIYPDILSEFAKAYLEPPYGLEDLKEFIDWVDENMEKY